MLRDQRARAGDDGAEAGDRVQEQPLVEAVGGDPGENATLVALSSSAASGAREAAPSTSTSHAVPSLWRITRSGRASPAALTSSAISAW